MKNTFANQFLIMKKLLLMLSLAICVNAVLAQDTKPASGKKDWSKVNLGNRAADHFMISFGYLGWAGRPDTINTKGFSRTFNAALLFDFPFKTNPHLSAAIGLGVGTDNMFFEHTTINLINRQQIQFNADTANKYKKYKLATGYIEAPVELRFASNPENMNTGFKFALGVKVGALLDAHTKAKVDLDTDGFGGYVTKDKDKKFFNGTRFSGTARIGYGHFSVFGTYQINNFFKDGVGPAGIHPYSIGLTLSGL